MDLEREGRDWRPRRAEKMQWRRVGKDILVLHLTLKQYHILNHVAGRIWDLCDGTHSRDSISAILAAEFGVDQSTVFDDVVDTLSGFERLGILEPEVSP
jgi:hypothetical protein